MSTSLGVDSSNIDSPSLPLASGFGLKNFNKKFELKAEVTSGRYQGAKISFPSDKTKSINIGSSIDDDVVLFSADVSKNHFSIKSGSFVGNKVTLSSNNGSFTLEDGRIVNVGEWVLLSLPAIISFGDSSIKFEREFGMSKIGGFAKPGLILLSSALIGIMGMMFVSSQNNFQEITRSTLIKQVEPAIENSPNIEKLQSTAVLLKKQIAKIELENFLSVHENSDGSVLVSGIIPEELLPQWRSVLQWYDGQKNMSYLVNNVSSAKIDDFELSIKSVWLDGTDRVVILSDGNMARVGDVVKGGWLIKDILKDYISIARNKQTIKITY